MRIIDSKKIAKLLIFTIFLLAFSPAIFAEKAPGFKLPVRVKSSGLPPTNAEDYRIILEADSPHYPMPKGSENSRYTLVITGEGLAEFPELNFPSRGIYTYTIYQISGTNRLGTYDNTRYQLVVYVTNAINGNESGLEITVLLYEQGEEDKLDEVLFNNSYSRRPIDPPVEPPEEPPEEPTPRPIPRPTPPTPDDPEIVDEIIEITEDIPEAIPEPIDEIEEIDEPIPLDVPDPPSTDLPDVPKTGDYTVILPYIGLFISGAALTVILGFTIKKKDIE